MPAKYSTARNDGIIFDQRLESQSLPLLEGPGSERAYGSKRTPFDREASILAAPS